MTITFPSPATYAQRLCARLPAEERTVPAPVPAVAAADDSPHAPPKSTRQWAEENAYDGTRLFQKVPDVAMRVCPGSGYAQEMVKLAQCPLSPLPPYPTHLSLGLTPRIGHVRIWLLVCLWRCLLVLLPLRCPLPSFSLRRGQYQCHPLLSGGWYACHKPQ